MDDTEGHGDLMSFEYVRPHDVDAAHARLRSHQATIDHITSRIEGNERRIDRIEKRMDDQSATLADLSGMAKAAQTEMHAQNGMLERVTMRTDVIIQRLDKHTAEEIREQQAQTIQMERLHRTIIRGVTVLTVVTVLLIAITNESNLFDLLLGVFQG